MSSNRKTFVATLTITLVILIGGYKVYENKKTTHKTTSNRGVISNIVVKRVEINSALDNLAQILAQAKISPLLSFDGRAVNGFQLDYIEQGSIYQKLGLHTGDKILSINEQKLFSPAKALELYNVLKRSENVQLTVDRQGTLITLNYILR